MPGQYGVDGRYRLALRVGGAELDWADNVVRHIAVHESCNQWLPTADVELYNAGDLFEEGLIHTGSPVEIAVSHRQVPQPGPDDIVRMRVFDYKIVRDEIEGVHVRLHCAYDAPAMLEADIESIDGPASDVAERVAGLCGLAPIVDAGSDRQIWIRPGLRAGAWLDDVCRHAWAGTSSCYVWAVRRNGELCFFDLSRRNDLLWRARAGVEDPADELAADEFHYVAPEFSCVGGALNAMHGYGRTYSSFNVLTGEWDPHEALDFQKRTAHIQVRPELKKPQKVENRPFFQGNTHDFYQTAAAQNLRYRSLYSTVVRCASSTPRDIQLLQRVEFKLWRHDLRRHHENYAGGYFVSHITTELNADGAMKTYTLLREGFQAGAPLL